MFKILYRIALSHGQGVVEGYIKNFEDIEVL